MEKSITRHEVEQRARQYINRVQHVMGGHDTLAPEELERIVQREIALTLRQMQACGWTIVDD